MRLKVCFPLQFAIKFCSEDIVELGHTLWFLQTCLSTLCLGILKEKPWHQRYRGTASICVKTQVISVTQTKPLETRMMHYPKCGVLNTKGKQHKHTIMPSYFLREASWRSFCRMMTGMLNLTTDDGIYWLMQREAGMIHFPSVLSRVLRGEQLSFIFLLYP